MRNMELFCLIAGKKAISGVSKVMMEMLHDVEVGNVTIEDISNKYDKIVRRIDSYYMRGEDAPQKLYDRKEELEYVMNYIGV